MVSEMRSSGFVPQAGPSVVADTTGLKRQRIGRNSRGGAVQSGRSHQPTYYNETNESSSSRPCWTLHFRETIQEFVRRRCVCLCSDAI